jgi:DNA-binding MarR family transcriptional regulator
LQISKIVAILQQLRMATNIMIYQKLKSIGYLTGKAHGLIKQRAQSYLEQNNIPLKMELFPIINTLWKEDNVSQQVIAETLGYDRHRISRMIDELENLGWVKRHPHPESRRENLVALTKMAREKESAIDEALSSAIGDALKGVTTDERRQLVESLVKIIQNLR